MNAYDVPPTRLARAIALSIAIHICMLWFAARTGGDREQIGAEPRAESVLFVTTIVHRAYPSRPRIPARQIASRPPPPVVTRPATGPRSKRVSHAGPARVAPPTAARASSARRQPKSETPRRTTLPAPAARIALVPPPAVPVARLSPTTPAATSTPSAAPTQTPAAANAGFSGLFSENYPPALATSAELASIRARAPGPVRIRVFVDENGRATDIRFLPPVPDDSLAQALRADLLALPYVPADCNGLRCEGTFEIAY